MKTNNPPHHNAPSVAVIGAGLSGLVCARTLLEQPEHTSSVKVFDKGRSPGGRMSTRQTGLHSFDHGAQYFTVRDPRFQHRVNAWAANGLVAEWNGKVCRLRNGVVSASENKKRYVGVPGMNAIAQHLAHSCSVLNEMRVASVHRQDQQWHLSSDTGQDLGYYDVVVVAVPAPQAVSLLEEASHLAARAAGVEMTGCWAVMLVLDQPVDVPLDGAFVQDSALSWIARNGSKPGRGNEDCWVLHASPEWSEAHLEASPEWVTKNLIEAFCQATACRTVRPSFTQAHRWRYALPASPLEDSCLFDPALAIGACGDWCAGPRVEGAFLSGLAVADRIMTFVGS